MKKLFLVLAVAALSFSTAIAQDAAAAAPAEEATVENAEAAPVAEEAVVEEAVVDPEVQIAGESLHHVLMQKFLEGGWGWMLPILIVLVLGLAIAIERILFLGLSTINTKKFIAAVEKA
ncbi:MAG: MotA/TolQ/ExbB proton channel family protein, partial [Alistipes sp.]|nr:MotA/TolQ/ExbB proton channel family protein [Alistipes sp.]